jgi:NADPH2:quinone reductase
VVRPYGYVSMVDLKDAVDLSPLMSKSVTVFMETIFTRIIFKYEYELVNAVLQELLQLIGSKEFVSPVNKVFKGLTVDNIKAAHTILEKGQGVGKIVMTI